MTLAELHKKKPIADSVLIEIHLPYGSFAEYIKTVIIMKIKNIIESFKKMMNI